MGQLWRAWTHRRVQVVREHLRAAGIDIETMWTAGHREPPPNHEPPPTNANADRQQAPPEAARGGKAQGQHVESNGTSPRDSIQEAVCRAIRRMPAEEVERLSIPIRYLAPDLLSGE